MGVKGNKTDVAQLVIRTRELDSNSYRYFLARRTKDRYWEWIGGKRKEGENMKEAAIRELKEEIKIEWDEYDYEVVEIAEKYPSEDNPKYKLHPVLIEVDRADFSENDLSKEHDKMAWIELDEFDEYETLGQLKAVRELELVQGDAVVGALECPERGFLIVRRSENETMTGQWEFTGGGVEEHDKGLEETVVREVKEESGFEAEIRRKGNIYIGEGATGYWILHPFVLEANPEDEVKISEEHDMFKWVEVEDMENMETVGEMKAVENLGLESR